MKFSNRKITKKIEINHDASVSAQGSCAGTCLGVQGLSLMANVNFRSVRSGRVGIRLEKLDCYGNFGSITRDSGEIRRI